MTEAEAQILGNRAAAAAVALHRSRRVRSAWLSGMLIRYGDRREPHDVDRIGGADGRDSSRPIAGSPWWPDPRDVATVGCWLALAREAWRLPALYVEPEDKDCEPWSVEGIPDPGGDEFNGSIYETSEAKALVVALEMAVFWAPR